MRCIPEPNTAAPCAIREGIPVSAPSTPAPVSHPRAWSDRTRSQYRTYIAQEPHMLNTLNAVVASGNAVPHIASQ
eukprot:150903-Rhodomonas_salina.1